jgi:hypothetical protein
MSDQPTPETDALKVSAEAALGLARTLKRERDEAREIARDLRDCLEVALGKIANVRRHFGETYVWDSLVNEDIIEQCEVSLAKSKEVLP